MFVNTIVSLAVVANQVAATQVFHPVSHLVKRSKTSNGGTYTYGPNGRQCINSPTPGDIPQTNPNPPPAGSGGYGGSAPGPVGDVYQSLANAIANIDMSKFGSDDQSCLNMHNYLRSLLGVAPLTWNSDLASQATNWSKTCASQDVLHHSDLAYGENVGMTNGETYTCASGVLRWFEEYKSYAAGVPSNSEGYHVWGHFTQVAFPSTQQVGCGMATAASGAQYLTCEYSPAGNNGIPVPFTYMG
ncbi:hypothetical protein HDV06_000849 [Boothiomyces sp. JEL0866]|nr:hypothetical protein HDV06_000840 [Boothiomyces sp. JEL0866]KAJ3318081.1 hypothetical protein HDV06_000849 [Boothiomyces sp. JEL0866]